MTPNETAYLVNLFQESYLRRLQLTDAYNENPVSMNYILKELAEINVETILHICHELGIDSERLRRAGIAAWEAHCEEVLMDWRRQCDET